MIPKNLMRYMMTMMNTNNIFVTYIEFGATGKGKRRPVLLLEEKHNRFFIFRIASKYQTKSIEIRKHYFPIKDWQLAGLRKASWIDTGEVIALEKLRVHPRWIGRLTNQDSLKLLNFLDQRLNHEN